MSRDQPAKAFVCVMLRLSGRVRPWFIRRLRPKIELYSARTLSMAEQQNPKLNVEEKLHLISRNLQVDDK